MNYPGLKSMIAGKRLVFCGIGSAFHAIVKDLAGIDYSIAALLDNNPQKHGTLLYGTEITPFSAIRSIAFDYVVLATPFYADIIHQLNTFGIDNSRFIRLGASYSFGCSIFATHAAQQQLTNKSFTLISDDCWGGILYSWLGLQFLTPFINLIVPPQDFCMLAEDVEYHLAQDVLFHPEDQKTSYPVGALGDVRIHFVHDKTRQEARQKWQRRSKRINLENVFFKFESENPEHIQAVDRLPVPRKIIFTRNRSVSGSSVIILDDCDVDGPQLHRTCATCLKKVDLVNWLNTGELCLPPHR